MRVLDLRDAQDLRTFAVISVGAGLRSLGFERRGPALFRERASGDPTWNYLERVSIGAALEQDVMGEWIWLWTSCETLAVRRGTAATIMVGSPIESAPSFDLKVAADELLLHRRFWLPDGRIMKPTRVNWSA
jgi:hypothetical protein